MPGKKHWRDVVKSKMGMVRPPGSTGDPLFDERNVPDENGGSNTSRPSSS